MSYDPEALAQLAKTKMDLHEMTAREACDKVCGSLQLRGREAEKVRTALEKLLCSSSALSKREKNLLAMAAKQIKESGRLRLPYRDD